MKEKNPQMTTEILQKMDERRWKSLKGWTGNVYNLNHEIQIMCRQAKNKKFNKKYEEIEQLHDTHNPMMYKKNQ